MYSVLAHLGLVDFHGSRIRRSVQSFLLRRRAFSAFQLTGRIGKIVLKEKSAQRTGEK
jgi:hypothetical protein